MIKSKDKHRKQKDKWNYRRKDFNNYKGKIKDGKWLNSTMINSKLAKKSIIIINKLEPKELLTPHRSLFSKPRLAYNPINLSYDNNQEGDRLKRFDEDAMIRRFVRAKNI